MIRLVNFIFSPMILQKIASSFLPKNALWDRLGLNYMILFCLGNAVECQSLQINDNDKWDELGEQLTPCSGSPLSLPVLSSL